MNAIKLLRNMHAETKVAFKVILGTDDPAVADLQWRAVQPALTLHEELEDELVYVSLRHVFGPRTPLGDWAEQHDADVAVVEQLILESGELEPGTPEWQMCVATIMDVLSKHMMDEENQIFGRVEQVWDAAQLEQLGAKMQQLMTKTTRTKPTKKSAPARRRR